MTQDEQDQQVGETIRTLKEAQRSYAYHHYLLCDVGKYFVSIGEALQKESGREPAWQDARPAEYLQVRFLQVIEAGTLVKYISDELTEIRRLEEEIANKKAFLLKLGI